MLYLLLIKKVKEEEIGQIIQKNELNEIKYLTLYLSNKNFLNLLIVPPHFREKKIFRGSTIKGIQAYEIL